MKEVNAFSSVVVYWCKFMRTPMPSWKLIIKSIFRFAANFLIVSKDKGERPVGSTNATPRLGDCGEMILAISSLQSPGTSSTFFSFSGTRLLILDSRALKDDWSDSKKKYFAKLNLRAMRGDPSNSSFVSGIKQRPGPAKRST